MEVVQGEGADELQEVESRLVEERLLVSALECPVCLSLPHSPPVYTCRVGTVHLIRKISPVRKTFQDQHFHPRLAILCVAAVGEVFLADAQFASTNITGEFIQLNKVGWKRIEFQA